MCGQQPFRFALLRILGALLVLLTSPGPVMAGATLYTTGASSEAARSYCGRVFPFAPDNFSNPTQIDNQWLPLIPGTRLILEGQANRGGGGTAHIVSFTVTDLTKVINGVRSVIVLDLDINDGVLVERELAFFAQDDDGKVWNLGEYPEEFEAGEFAGAPSVWMAGLARAKAGVHMVANPRVGTPRYLQGVAPKIEFLDCAKVFKKGLKICVPFNCYEDVLLTDENSPLDPGNAHQRKYHAPGVGIVQIGAVNDPEAETLALIKVVHLSPEKLSHVREAALKLDRRGYRYSPDVYAHTPPAEYTPPDDPDFETLTGSSPDVEAVNGSSPDVEAVVEFWSNFEAEHENQNAGQVQWIYLPLIFR